MNKYSEILQALAQAPENQCDPQVLPRFQALADKADPKSDELLDIIDDCVYASLCSDMVVVTMDAVWRSMLQDENLTRDEAFAAAMGRRRAKEAAR